jgi:hypothetical protein
LIVKSVAIISALLVFAAPALAQQQQDPAKLAPLFQRQRNNALDDVAGCALVVIDLQTKISELEKKLAETATQQK